MTDGNARIEAAFEGTDLRGERHGLPWTPSFELGHHRPDAVVRFGGAANEVGSFATLQGAIDHAVAEHTEPNGRARRYLIELGAGFFEGPVVVPAGAPPLDIIGAGAGETVLAAGIDAGMSGSEYAARFAETIQAAGPKSKELLAAVTARQRISTGNTAVLRVCSHDVRLAGLTIRNDYACDRVGMAPPGAEPDVEGRFARGQHQAVALMLDGVDRTVVKDCVLTSFQDTLYLKAKPGLPTRSAFLGCEIEGDVDFIFGGATASFQTCTIRSRSVRGAKGWALAPSTALTLPYGFIFESCDFVDDLASLGFRCFLGRQWFEGVRATPYGIPTIHGYSCKLADANSLVGADGFITKQTLESVGKCTLAGCQLGTHLDPGHLWDDWASGPWTPRFRPAQLTLGEFLENLNDWLPSELRHFYSEIEPTPWVVIED